MTLTNGISFIACIVAIGMLIIKLAELNDEARARLVRWTSAAGLITRYLFAVIAMLNGFIGMAIFHFSSGPPSRTDVMALVLYLLNVGIGIWQISSLAKERGRKAAPAPIRADAAETD